MTAYLGVQRRKLFTGLPFVPSPRVGCIFSAFPGFFRVSRKKKNCRLSVGVLPLCQPIYILRACLSPFLHLKITDTPSWAQQLMVAVQELQANQRLFHIIPVLLPLELSEDSLCALVAHPFLAESDQLYARPADQLLGCPLSL